MPKEITTPGDGPDPGVVRLRRQPGAVGARRRRARARRSASSTCWSRSTSTSTRPTGTPTTSSRRRPGSSARTCRSPFLGFFTHAVHPDHRGGRRAARRGAPGVGGHRRHLAADRRRALLASGPLRLLAQARHAAHAARGSSTCCCAPARRATCFGLRRGGLASRSCARNPHGIVLAEHIATGVLAQADPPPRQARAPRRAGDRARELARLASPRTATIPDFPLRLIGLRELRSHNSWMHNAPLLMRGGRTHAAAHPSRRRRGARARRRRALPDQLARTGRSRSPATVTDEMKRGHGRAAARLGPPRRLAASPTRPAART